MQKNPDYDCYPDLLLVSEEMLSHVTSIDEFFVDTVDTDLKPVAIEALSFVLPYDNWKEIKVPDSVLTHREQEIPHFYKWWDELRYSRCLLDFCISQYYNLIINQSYSLERL